MNRKGNKVMGAPKEVFEILKKNGNNFHAKVARWLNEHDWHVIVSPYYMDQTQNKAREIDLIAEKSWPVIDKLDRSFGDVVARLFIECKYISSHSVFWFTEKDQESALNLVCTSRPFKANNMYTDRHHYLAQDTKVAKLFATNSKKDTENEPFYKALNQVLNAMVSMRDRSVSIPEIKESKRILRAVIEFPVVVCSSFDVSVHRGDCLLLVIPHL
jgi:hypothetical protein